ncbi:hypothetical protein D3C84_388070 [compost metagenome]
MYVHGVADAIAAAFGQVVLENRRQHRGLFPKVDGAGGQHASAVHQPGIAANARQGFLNAFEGGQGDVELFADARVLAGHQAGVFGDTATHGRQGDGAADRQAIHQHHPAFAEHGLATNEVVQRNEHVLAAVGAVHEGCAQGQMAAADLDTGSVGRYQRQANPQVDLIAEQVVGIIGLEGNAEQGRNRAEGNVALFPIEAQAQGFLALPLAFANDSCIGHRAGIGAGQRAGQGKAGDFFATRQAW